MSQIDTPFGPLESLVARTFERDGITKEIIGICTDGIVYRRRYSPEDAALIEADGNGRWIAQVFPARTSDFLEWLQGATEVRET